MARGRSITVTAIVVLATVGTCVAEDYLIKLDRPAKVGFKEVVSIEAEFSAKVTTKKDGMPNSEQEYIFTVQLDGTTTVVAANERGVVTEATLEVARSSVTYKTLTEDILPKGTVLTAKAEGTKTVLSAGDKPLKEEIVNLLEWFFRLNTTGVSDDEIRATGGRKNIGDTWSINSAAMSKSYAADGYVVKPEDCKGITTLKGVSIVDGVECLEIVGHDSYLNMQGPAKYAKGVVSYSESVDWTTMLPTDTTKYPPIGKCDAVITSTTATTDANGNRTSEEIVRHISMTTKFTPVKE